MQIRPAASHAPGAASVRRPWRGRTLAATAVTAVTLGMLPLVALAQGDELAPTDEATTGDIAPADDDTTPAPVEIPTPATPTTPTTPTVPTNSTIPTNPPTTGSSTTTTTQPPVVTATTTTTTTTIPVDAQLPPRAVPATTVPTAPVPTVTPGPVSTATPSEPTARGVTVYPEQIQHILATIRYLESRGIYTLPPNKGNASGAYQFIASTWNNYGGYAHAYLAPPEIQDERAALDVNKFLAQFDNDVSMVPVMWYLPAAVREPWRMDVVPSPQHGNVLTIREYQTRWLGVFAFISGQPLEPLLTGEQAKVQAGTPPEVPERVGGVPSIAYPVLGPSRAAVPECDDAEQIEVADVDAEGVEPDGPSRADIEAAGLCSPQAPGIVFGVKLQPVMAVADGIVTDVVDEPGTDQPISVTVTDETGLSYVYAGFNDDNPGTDDGNAPDHLRLSALAEVGNAVRAGQIIGFMGDTDPLPVGVRADVPTDSTVVLDPNAVAPHIRLTMIDIGGRPVDAFGPLVDALFRQTCAVTIGQWSIPGNGSGHDPVVIETTDDRPEIDSEWVITSTGQVTASGWAAMVNPNEGCVYTPDTPHGPGADGSELGLVHWFTPVELPTEVWVALALQDEFTSPGGLLRPG